MSIKDKVQYKDCMDCMGRAGRPLFVSKAREEEEKKLEIINEKIMNNKKVNDKKVNAIWLETSGCFGEIISLLNSDKPDILYLLNELVNMVYFESIAGNQGEKAYNKILEIIDGEYILIVSGAIPIKSEGKYAVLATYNGKEITAMEAVSNLAKKAKHIISVGTCAVYGGPTATRPNTSEAKGVKEFLGRSDVINLPGCPTHPAWLVNTLAYLINYGELSLDEEGRPIAFYGVTIHSRCPKRKYYDKGIFARKIGDDECMFKLGCRGPITKVFCPVSRWNESYNWPIGDKTACIGWASKDFTDDMAPLKLPSEKEASMK